MSETLTYAEAAAIIGVSRQTLYDRINSGRYENTDPAGIVRQEIEYREQELVVLRRRLAAFVNGSSPQDDESPAA